MPERKLTPAAKKVIPHINRERCEGKGHCVEVCPYDVLLVKTLAKEERSTLSLKGRIKGFFHHWQQAFVVDPDQCLACGLCAVTCPEKAIQLIRIK